MQADVIVVGAGVAGLSCATYLAQTGLRVLVLEESAVPGGRARSWADPRMGDAVDIGPHVLLNKYANMRALLSRLGTADQVCWHTEELLTVLDKHRHIHVRLGRAPAPLHYLRNLFRILPSVPLHALLSNVPLAWRTARASWADIRALDDRTGLDYLLASGVDRRFIDWFWASASMALLNVPVEQCSAAALMRVFAHMLGHNDVAFGFPKVGLSELYAWPAIAQVERHGGQVRLGCGVRALVAEQGKVVGVRTGEGMRMLGPVVMAVPPAAASALLPAALPLAGAAARLEPSPYISCYLWFRRRLSDARFWARPWSPREFNTDFYDLANIRDGAAQGSIVATNIIWSHRAHGMADEDIVAATVREIRDFAPSASPGDLVHAAVHRIPMSVPCALPGMETARPATRQLPGLFVAGDWADTGLPFCMESASRAGALAAEASLESLGRPRRLALPVPAPGGITGMLGGRTC
ncbi:hydroxysqualene dehydroxylase [Bordetella genomosp. 13]|uniref:Amine oxidase domain-containing protein n=1 Tax=Bordetella genomosp. 13 TaxID=463040 RepID=A0A1W6ZCW1_9BORD|nr:FAD-dependent oxidoreductase [Bordetella genomosp. 13]ARP95082.1 hypothetical protein CAL15_12270 [Bordetella genomosp. 13]